MTLLHRLVASTVLFALSAATHAQPTKKPVRIGYLAGVSASADAPRLAAFRQGLRELGYVEGQTIQIEYRHESADLQRLPDHAADLVRGNITGITNVAAVLAGKRLELLKEVLPRLTRVAVLWDPKAPGSVPQWEASREVADKLGLQLYSMQVSAAEDYPAAFKAAAKARSHAVWVTLNPVANSNQKLLAELAIENALPSICARADYSENGCLMAYGPGYQPEGSDGARYVDRILKGARPADLPIEQPTKFELIVNLKTASRIGVAVPLSVLDRADKLVR